MLRTAGDEVDAGGFDAGMPEQIGEFGDVMADAVESPREQVPQVVRKNLGGRNACEPADRFHLRPDPLSG